MDKKIESLTLIKLNKQKELVYPVTIGLAVVLFLNLTLIIYLFIKNGEMTPLFAVPLALLPIVLISADYLKKVKIEINKRNFKA